MNIGHKKSRSISALCSLLGYSRQAFYQQKRSFESHFLQEELVIQQVLQIRSRQRRVGTRKLYYMLQSFMAGHNISMGRDALFAMLRQHGLLIRKRRRKAPRTTFSDNWQNQFPNLIIGLPINHSNRVWVSDITYVNLIEDFAYLSLITDAYSHMIVGHHLSKDLKTTGCLQALKRALRSLSTHDTLIHHSDRGCQYCSIEYVSMLQSNSIDISMTQNSDPRENAIAERVNGILKQELFDSEFTSLPVARKQIEHAISIYNNERLHASIDMLTPFEAQTKKGVLKKHWKNYYKITKEKEVEMT